MSQALSFSHILVRVCDSLNTVKVAYARALDKCARANTLTTRGKFNFKIVAPNGIHLLF